MHPLVLSFEIAALATLAASITGVAAGALLADRRLWGRDVIDVLITVPMVLPPTVLGYYVLSALGRTSVIGRAFEDLTGGAIVFSRTGAVVAAAIAAFPLVVKAARASIEAVDPRLVAAARTLGASPSRAFVTVTLPLARRGIIAGATLAFARALGEFGVTLMVAGNIPGVTRTASLAIYDAVEADKPAEARGLVLALTALAIASLYLSNKLARGDHHGP